MIEHIAPRRAWIMLHVWRSFDIAAPRDFACLWEPDDRGDSSLQLWEDLEHLQDAGLLDVWLDSGARRTGGQKATPVPISEVPTGAREAAVALPSGSDSEFFLSLSDPAEAACREWFEAWGREDEWSSYEDVGQDISLTVRDFRELAATSRNADPAVLHQLDSYVQSRRRFLPLEIVPSDAITALISARLAVGPRRKVAVRLAGALLWGQEDSLARERFLMSSTWPELLTRNYFLG